MFRDRGHGEAARETSRKGALRRPAAARGAEAQRHVALDVVDAELGEQAREPRVVGRVEDLEADVDVGFQVFNTANYPRLTRLFAELGVDHVESDMSLSFGSAGGCWSSKRPFAGCFASGFSVATVVAVARRAALLLEVLRFERLAKAHAADAAADAA